MLLFLFCHMFIMYSMYIIICFSFSGLTADDLKNVSTSIRDIQAIFLHMFNSKTILIGHSLESDLVALKV